MKAKRHFTTGTNYAYGDTPFARALLIWSSLGLVYLNFRDEGSTCKPILPQTWPKELLAIPLVLDRAAGERWLSAIFMPKPDAVPLKILLIGTTFQVNVWRELLQTKPGESLSYKELARRIGKPKAMRAVGRALSANCLAYLVPCHRVIKSSGLLGAYRWGEARKKAIAASEQRCV